MIKFVVRYSLTEQTLLRWYSQISQNLNNPPLKAILHPGQFKPDLVVTFTGLYITCHKTDKILYICPL